MKIFLSVRWTKGDYNRRMAKNRFSLAQCTALILAVALLTTTQGCSGNDAPLSGQARHVILISMDTTRPDYLGCYGNPWIKTPNLDQLAAESLLLTRFTTVAPTTLASHTSLFTGKYPHTHGVPRNGFRVNEKNVMLTETLKENGFHTAGFLGSFALATRFHFNQGFDHFDQNFDMAAGKDGRDQVQRSAQSVTDTVIQYLTSRKGLKNLFLFVHYFDPHAPYSPPKPYDDMYKKLEVNELCDYLEPGRKLDYKSIEDRNYLLTGGKDASELKWNVHHYAGEISYMDGQIGRLLKYLKKSGILDNAVVIVTSDHGESMWDHDPYFDHGFNTYNSVMRIVGMIRLPQGRLAGKKIDRPVQNIDILPTLLRYMHLPIPPDTEGLAFDLLTPESLPAIRPVFCQATRPHVDIETDPRWYNILKSRSITKGHYKFIQTPYKNVEELYDLKSDPNELNNLLLGKIKLPLTSRKETDKAELEAWANSAAPLPARFSRRKLDETLNKLKSLGYL